MWCQKALPFSIVALALLCAVVLLVPAEHRTTASTWTYAFQRAVSNGEFKLGQRGSAWPIQQELLQAVRRAATADGGVLVAVGNGHFTAHVRPDMLLHKPARSDEGASWQQVCASVDWQPVCALRWASCRAQACNAGWQQGHHDISAAAAVAKHAAGA